MVSIFCHASCFKAEADIATCDLIEYFTGCCATWIYGFQKPMLAGRVKHQRSTVEWPPVRDLVWSVGKSLSGIHRRTTLWLGLEHRFAFCRPAHWRNLVHFS